MDGARPSPKVVDRVEGSLPILFLTSNKFSKFHSFNKINKFKQFNLFNKLNKFINLLNLLNVLNSVSPLLVHCKGEVKGHFPSSSSLREWNRARRPSLTSLSFSFRGKEW